MIEHKSELVKFAIISDMNTRPNGGEGGKTNGYYNNTFTDSDRILVDSLFSALAEAKSRSKPPKYIDLEYLRTVLDKDQLGLVERVYDIDPTVYGFKGQFVGIEDPPKDFKQIEPQPFFENEKAATTRPHDLPVTTYNAFTAMADAMRRDIGRPLLITSSYRTSAKQALVFLAYLRLYGYDVARTVKRVAIPGYSEHGTPSKLALDLQNVDGLPSAENPTDFENTVEYKWLLKNASRFNFYLSYPKNNEQGMMFEPWHWRHMPANDAP